MIVVVAGALAVTGLVAMSSVILPIVLGLLFACGLYPVVESLDRRRVPRAVSSAVAVLGLTVGIGAVLWLTVRAVVDQWGEISSLLAAGQATLSDAAADGGADPGTVATVADDLGHFVGDVVGMLMGGLVQLVPTIAAFVATVLLSFLVAFFFLKDGASMWAWVLAGLGDTAELVDRIGQGVWQTLSGFILGQTVIAAVDASLITLGALLLGVPEAGAIFMITFVGAYIPFIGAFASGLVAVLLALGDSGLRTGSIMLAVVIVVQVLEGNVLQPWIQGRAVRLHPLVIALAVAAGGALAGFLGVFLAVPVTAAGFVMLSELRRAGIVGPLPVVDAEARGRGGRDVTWRPRRRG